MSNLVALAPDCIAHLLEYLSGNDIHSLLSTGDYILRHKVANNVGRLHLFVRHNEDFPFSALRLPQLRAFCVEGNYSSYLRFEKDDMTESSSLERRNSRLTSLSLEFPNSAAFFCRPGSLSLKERFPSLTQLSLIGFGHNALVKSFARLPRTLTEISLRCYESLSVEMKATILDIFEIAKLPRTLLKLELVGYSIEGPQENGNCENSAIRDIWPPHLISLNLSRLSSRTISSYIPQSLEKLELEFSLGMRNAFPYETSLLPRNLSYLKLSVPLKFDSPLPPRLVSFDLPDATSEMIKTRGGGDPNWAGLPVPSNLEYDNYYECTMDDFRRLKSVVSLRILSQSELDELLEQKVEKYPTRIRTARDHIRITKPLPSCVKELDIQDLMFGEDAKMLPRQLEELRLANDSSMALSASWTLEQVGDLPKFLRFLHFPFSLVDDGSNLAPISEIFLEDLSIGSIPSQHLEYAPQWLPSCLPLHLKHLSLHMEDSEDDTDDTTISPDCIRLCCLYDAVPHLESLLMEIEFNNNNPMGPLLDSLPSQLLQLTLMRLAEVFEPGALLMAPKNLQYLNIDFDDSYDEEHIGCITNEHLCGLPEKIEFLVLTTPTRPKINHNVIQFFPKSLNEVYFPSLDSSQSTLSAKIEEHIISNSCPRYLDL